MARTRTKGTVAAIAFAAAGVALFAVFRSAPVEAVYPVERAKASFSRRVWSRLAGMWRGAEASAENVRLKREISSLAMDRAEYARVLAENERLRKALAFGDAKPGMWIAAEVLSFGGGAAGVRDTVRVGKGSLAGVREGAVVEAPEGLVGIVESTTPHTSEILLITDPSLRVSCCVEGTPKRYGILSGGEADALVLRHLRSAAGIAPGAKVYTSGLGGVFPKGVEVGSFQSASGGGLGASRPTSVGGGLGATRAASVGGALGATRPTNVGGAADGERGADALEAEGEVRPGVDFASLETVFIRK